MKLRNKRTGEIDDFIFEVITDRIDLYRRTGHSDTKNIWHYNSLSELNADWEDVPEEPKEYWYIDDAGVIQIDQVLSSEINMRKSIGNYFSSREEAELAVRKFKAWEGMKEKIIDHVLKYEFDELTEDINAIISFSIESYPNVGNDLDLLFGGEE